MASHAAHSGSMACAPRERIASFAHARAHAIDFTTMLAPAFAEIAAWYVSYANVDRLACIEWQLAERSDRLEGNPFVPLLRCHAAGYLPFALDARTVVLFTLRP